MQLFRKQPQEQTPSNHVDLLQTQEESVEEPLPSSAIHIETLAERTAWLTQKSKKQELLIVYSMATLVSSIFLIVGVTAWMQHRNLPEPEWFNSYFPAVIFILGCLPGLRMAANIVWRRKAGSNLVKEILRQKRPDVIPLLLDIISSDCTNKQAMFRAHAALQSLLLEVREEDEIHFKARHVQHLNSLLTRIVASVHGEPPSSVELKTSIVQALRYVGDEQSLKHLHRLQQSRPNMNTAYNEFYSAVESVIPALELRVQKLKEHGTLLRASSEPTNNETLLRPAYGGAREPEQDLLRPIESE